MNSQRPGCTSVHLDCDALMRAIEERLQTEGRSIRSLGRELGIWASMFTRLRAGNEISANALVALLMWLDRPASDFAMVLDREEL